MRKYKVAVRKTTFQEAEIAVEATHADAAANLAVDAVRAAKHVEWIRYDDFWKATLVERLDLDAKCPECYGRKYWRGMEGDDVPCSRCTT